MTCAIQGSINCDEYFYVNAIARPGETISSHAYARRVGGKGVNQAIAILKAGGAAKFYGTIGTDGLWVKDTVTEQFGLDGSGINVDPELPIGRALIQVADNGENSIILFPGANHSQLHERTFPGSTHLLLQNEIHALSTLHALTSAPASTTTIFNPSPLPPPSALATFPFDKVDWLIVNAGEALHLHLALSTSNPDPDPRAILTALATHPALVTTNIICTLGESGVLASLPSHPIIYLPAASLRGPVLDTTGAGDCFTGYFVQGLMELGPNAIPTPEDVTRILKTCVQAAGMCVERQGTIDSIPTRAEVEARMSK